MTDSLLSASGVFPCSSRLRLPAFNRLYPTCTHIPRKLFFNAKARLAKAKNRATPPFSKLLCGMIANSNSFKNPHNLHHPILESAPVGYHEPTTTSRLLTLNNRVLFFFRLIKYLCRQRDVNETFVGLDDR